jgi:CubicO group peptidase (beta-lactamase class C family)
MPMRDIEGLHGVAVVRSAGTVVLTAAAEPHGPDTVFQIGSISKAYAAALVLRLADKGLLSLTDPAGDHHHRTDQR